MKREIRLISEQNPKVYTIIGDDDLGDGVKIEVWDDTELSGSLCFDIPEALEIARVILVNYQTIITELNPTAEE